MKTSVLVSMLLGAASASAAAMNPLRINPQLRMGNFEKFQPNSDLSVPGTNPLEFCADPKDYVLTIESVTLLPNPPEAGKTLKIEATGVLHDVITKGAVVEVIVKYGYIQLVKEKIDLCDNVHEVDLECPIKDGKLVLVKEVDLPAAIPPGKYVVSANVLTADERIITCLKGEVTFPINH